MRLFTIKKCKILAAIFSIVTLVILCKLAIFKLEEKQEEIRIAKKNELLLLKLKEMERLKAENTPSPFPLFPLSITSKTGSIYLIKKNEVLSKMGEVEKQLTFDGQIEGEKSLLGLSPNERYLSYFQDLSPKEGMSDDKYYWHNYTSLRILEVATRKSREIYRGSFKVGSYEWLTDREIAVWVGCGTECSYLELVDIFTKSKRQLMYGVGYTWSLNKKYVLAYHYAVQPGITVGDKFGNELLTLRREYPQNGENTSTHKASWSPDSLKLALIINKDKEAKLELLVFDVENDFKLTKQKDLEEQEFSDLRWEENNVISYQSPGQTKIVRL